LDLRGEDQDTCGGDSGGGLFIPNRRWSAFTEDPELDEHSDAADDVQDILVGITSYGDGKFGCGDEGTFGIYTDVLYWKDWIKRTIAENS
jgi:secreted trypsin-like serine protease